MKTKEIYVTSNDTQIDLLLRRHARRATRDRVADHLDADELTAFAEGSVPGATRARFVSHLADCDDCRKLVTQLATASGAAATSTVPPETISEGTTWSKKLRALFAPARLRYAAFALVLLAAATVTFVVLRDRSARQIAERTASPSETESAELKQAQQTKTQSETEDKGIAKSAPAAPQGTQAPNVAATQQESSIPQNTQPPAAPKQTSEAAANSATVTANQPAEKRVAEAVPSFAPPPPGETERAQQTQNRAPQTVGGLAGRKDESANANLRALDRATSNEMRSARSGVVRTEPAVRDRPAASAGRAADDKSLANAKESDTVSVTSSNANEVRMKAAAPKAAAKKAPPPAVLEERQETRAGGHKFRRQGNAWVDTKFKSSMTVRSITRGSDEYGDLDGGIRSIAEQLGGDALIVWKGKAYRIH